jgi:hypothetical protein
MNTYYFRQSKIWDGTNAIDPNSKIVKVKRANPTKARKYLGKPDTGRTWIQVNSSGEPIQ